jgi:hypothetical protein
MRVFHYVAELDRKRWWLRYVALFALAAVGVAIAFHLTERTRYRLDATITLTGGSCRAHRSECAKLARGGTVAVYGGGSPKRADLHGAVTHVHFSLEPGAYVLAFPVGQYSILVTDLTRKADGEQGGFTLGDHALDLGVVRPSREFTYEGD